MRVHEGLVDWYLRLAEGGICENTYSLLCPLMIPRRVFTIRLN